MKLYLFLKRPS